MLSLIIDTSTDYSLIALASEEGILDERSFPPSPQQSRFLLASINDLLTGQKMTLKDLCWISIGIGPGSFTGTRCGIMIAKSLGYGLDIPLIPFCSLTLFIPEKDGPFDVLSDAKSGLLYSFKGEKMGQNLILEAPVLIKREELSIPSLEFNIPLLHHYLYAQAREKKFQSPEAVEALYLKSP